jgi:hypothetical protein
LLLLVSEVPSLGKLWLYLQRTHMHRP